MCGKELTNKCRALEKPSNVSFIINYGIDISSIKSTRSSEDIDIDDIWLHAVGHCGCWLSPRVLKHCKRIVRWQETDETRTLNSIALQQKNNNQNRNGRSSSRWVIMQFIILTSIILTIQSQVNVDRLPMLNDDGSAVDQAQWKFLCAHVRVWNVSYCRRPETATCGQTDTDGNRGPHTGACARRKIGRWPH